jgi:hypothetical protein
MLAITLKEHGGVRGEARFPPYKELFIINNISHESHKSRRANEENSK